MKRAIPLFGLLLLSSLLHTAHAESGDASANEAHQARPVPAFHGIDLAGTLGVDVTVAPGKPGAVELYGDADLFDKVTTTVKDGILVIDTHFPKNRHNLHMHAVVSASDLSSLMLSGTGQIKAAGISTPSLALSMPGTGELKVAGTTTNLRIDLNGTGSVSAKKLTSKSASVTMSGTGSATLEATDSVVAELSGTGSIDVHGHPARVTQRKSGLGSIHIR